MAKRKQENKLWDKARYSLEKHYSYICSNPHSERKKLKQGFINIGISGIIPDVIGIKDIGNQYEPKIEIITVEVKETLPNYKERHMDQVRRAALFSHKVFLAAPREFRPEEVELAVKERIGLFELDPTRKRLKLIVPSPPFEPAESKVIELMRRLEFYKCSVCSCYWNKNLINVTGYRPTHVFSQSKKNKYVKFICEKCSEKLYELHCRDLKNKFAEEWKFKRLNKRTEKINSRIAKFAEKKEIGRIKNTLDKKDDKIKTSTRRLRESFNNKFENLNKKFVKLRRSLKAV